MNEQIKNVIIDLLEKIEDTAVLHRVMMILSRCYDKK